MSRFFTGGSSSSSESDGSEGEEQVVVKTTVASKAPAKLKANFDNSDDEEDTGKRTVRSEKEKRLEELQSLITKMTTAMKTHEWNSVNTDFDTLQKAYQKAATIVQKEGIPAFYLSFLIKLEDTIKDTVDNKNNIKMSPTNAKAFNAMRQKVKKYNAAFEAKIKEHRAKQPVKKEESESDEESDESSEEEKVPAKQVKATAAPAKAAKATGKPVKPSKAEDSDEDSDSDSDDKSDESDDESDSQNSDSDGDSDSDGGDVVDDGSSLTIEERRARWFLPAKKTDGKKAPAKPAPAPTPAVTDDKKTTATPAPNQEKPGEAKPEEKKEEKKEMNEEEIKAKLKEILKGRGKKTTNQTKQMTQLNELLPFASKFPQLQTEILAAICGVQFDMTPTSTQSSQLSNWWKASITMLSQLMAILEGNANIHVTEGEQKQATEEGETESYVSSLVGFIERLDDEFTRMLLALEIPTQDYLQRLNDEPLWLNIAERVQVYYEKEGKPAKAARIAARRIKHMYFRNDAALQTATAEQQTQNAKKAAENKQFLDKLSNLVYHHGDERLKAHTVLCQIYFLALHDFYFEARDLLLMSHLQENISHMDIATQILYNRATVQVGLCAFRAGLLKVAHGCLADLFAGGRIKELLAQGFSSRYGDKTQQQEQIEKKRQYPYHMHINTDLIEAVHLIAAMLVEVPNMAANPYDHKKKIISKTFRKLLDFHERQIFNGPPENNKESILSAAKNLMKGEWLDSTNTLMNLNIWPFMPNAEAVKTMLKKKIQEEALRTFLFTYDHVYDSLKLKDLCSMFGLSENEVRPLVTKMIYSEELRGSWDQPTDTLILHRVEPTKLQFLALQLADKAAQFVENNEKILDTRTGGYGYKNDKSNPQSDSRKERTPYNKPFRGPTVPDNRAARNKNLPNKRNMKREQDN